MKVRTTEILKYNFFQILYHGNCICYTEYFMFPDKVQMATHALQFMFLGDTGFKWPVAFYFTRECVAAELYIIFWDLVHHLMEYGFHVSFHITCLYECLQRS